MELQPYLPVILFILVGVAVGVVPQVLGFVFGPNRPDSQKNSPYECGFEAFEDARMKFDVRYYLVAILFILLPRDRLSLPLGRGAEGDRPHRLLGHDDLPGHPRGGLHLRVEERCPGLGISIRYCELRITR